MIWIKYRVSRIKKLGKDLNNKLSAMSDKKLSKNKYCQIGIPFYTTSNIVHMLSIPQLNCDIKE